MLMIKRFAACLLMLVLLSALVPVQAEGFYGFLPVREVEGKMYEARPESELTTILLIGYDHKAAGQEVELHGYSNGGQADFLLLVVLDHRNDTIRLLQIDRDTMTRVRTTDSTGYQRIHNDLQICLAHAYGNTREDNNANTILAVETLLGIEAPDDGVGIDWYVAMDISGISRLNDLLGGVTVTIDHDMTDVDPAMTAGATLRLTGPQAERFCRARHGVGDQTNASRMLRQRTFMTAAAEQLMHLVREDIAFADVVLDGMGIIYDRTMTNTSSYSFGEPVEGTTSGEAQGSWLMTNARRRTIVNALSQAVGYTIMPVETLPGKHTLGKNGYIRYDLTEGATMEWVLSVFYRGEK